jgi:hypothetical protein
MAQRGITASEAFGLEQAWHLRAILGPKIKDSSREVRVRICMATAMVG